MAAVLPSSPAWEDDAGPADAATPVDGMPVDDAGDEEDPFAGDPFYEAQRLARTAEIDAAWGKVHPKVYRRSRAERGVAPARSRVAPETKLRLLGEQGHRCCWCRQPMSGWLGGRKVTPVPGDTPTVEHIVPVFHGGPNCQENLVIACYDCNCSRGNDLEWRPDLWSGEDEAAFLRIVADIPRRASWIARMAVADASSSCPDDEPPDDPDPASDTGI